MKRFMYVAMLGWALMASLGAQAASKPMIGVSGFENTATGTYWRGGGAGWELTALLSNELSNTGKFSVVERNKLGPVLRGQNLAASGGITKTGGMIGAQHLVLATSTAFERKVQDTRGSSSFKGVSIPAKKDPAYIAMDLRKVNTTSGAVDYSRAVDPRSGGASRSLSLFRSEFDGWRGKANLTPAGKAIRAVIVEINDYLECAMVRQDGCMADSGAKENCRRQSLKDQIKLDGP